VTVSSVSKAPVINNDGMNFPPTSRNRPLRALLMLITLVGCGQGNDAPISPLPNNSDPANPATNSPATNGGAAIESLALSDSSSDPLVVDLPIAYIKRLLTDVATQNVIADDLTRPTAFQPGARLYLRERAAADAAEFSLTAPVFTSDELIDIKDLEVSTDGQQLLFALRAPRLEDAEDALQPTWDVWVYTVGEAIPRRIIAADITANEGDDIGPAFLPDGRIVFSSNRQRRSRSMLLDDGKPQYSGLVENAQQTAFNLHIMDADGGNIEQISFNQSHDLDPTVLTSGKILFLRWDHAANRNNLSFYSLNPDGSELQMQYGYHSQFTGTDASRATFWQNRLLPDGTLLSTLRPPQGAGFGGDLVSIDIQGFSDMAVPVANAIASTSSLLAQRSLSPQTITTNDANSPQGLYHGAYPLFDGTNRLLVSWSPCRLQAVTPPTHIVTCSAERLGSPDYTSAPPLFGLWLLDLEAQTQLPISLPVEGEMVTEVAVLAARPAAQFLPTQLAASDQQQQWVDDGVGLVQIRSVYDIAGVDTSVDGIDQLADPDRTPVAARPARLLRIVKAVSQPSDAVRDIANSAFGISRAQGMREILGYVPVEPDGSASFLVPADVAFGLSVLDNQGRRISERHNNWLHVRAGGQLTCHGCHRADSQTAHGRPDAEPATINTGAPTTGSPWPNTSPGLIPEMGETMAATLARLQGVGSPSVDVVLHDDWHPIPATDTRLVYSDLATPAPVSLTCQTSWHAGCRIIINYPEHIAPLWSLPRSAAGNVDATCITCHSPVDALGTARVAAAQLDLSNAPSADNDQRVTSYQELLRDDQALVLDATGTLTNELRQLTDNAGNPVLQTDDEGNLILDSNSQAIPILVTVNVPRSLSTNGAHASQRFFARFNPTGSHRDWLTPAELRLVAEWLDIGGQYYNNPFAAPVN
jgi:hypothetical protein